MQRKLLGIFVVVVGIFTAGNVLAGIHWLPDFLGKNNDRTTEGGTNWDGVKKGCPNSWRSENELGDMLCSLKGTYPWVGNCYGDCRCNTGIYQYTEANCNGEHYLAGTTCDDGTIRYKECRYWCDELTDNLINEEWGCKKYYEKCASKCEEPYTDSCHLATVVHKDKGYGCKPDGYYKDCPSKCEDPYEDNCHVRSSQDNSTKCGCSSYWKDCETVCEIGKPCQYFDCEGYGLLTCPSEYECDKCDFGWEYDTSPRYKFKSCASGFYHVESFVCRIDNTPQLCTWSLPTK